MIINKPGHMTKMTSIPIYGKTFRKSYSQELLKILQRNLTCSKSTQVRYAENCLNGTEWKNCQEMGK